MHENLKISTLKGGTKTQSRFEASSLAFTIF